MNMPFENPAGEHLREVALFVALHLGRAPGVLWPEHDHPLLSGDAGGDDCDGCDGGDGDGGVGGAGRDAADVTDPVATPDLDALAAQIAAATGLVARPAPDGAPLGHLLVHQVAGAASWTIAGADSDGQDASLRYRLRAGEVLYVPEGWARTVEAASGARWTVVVLTPGGAGGPTAASRTAG
ncbi:hypothetical protein ACFWN1_31905 [Streptomyces sp. NPDC058459]|uniref:hypothetical protein n=1 Tax=Streptomyces sp. NPDC058459 TaxID=3346508 RepID=UPI0036497C8A